MKKHALYILVIGGMLAPQSALADDAPPPEEEPKTIVVEPPPPPPYEHLPQKKPPTPVGLRFDGGWSPRRLFELGTTGADLGFAVGPQIGEHLAVWGTPRVFIGSTENGLSVWDVRVGAELEAVVGRFRIGGGVGLFVMGVHRAVRSETLLSYGPDLNISTRFDIVKTDDLAFFVRAAIDGSLELRGGSAFWGPAIGVGVQLDVNKKKDEPTSSARTGSAAALRF